MPALIAIVCLFILEGIDAVAASPAIPKTSEVARYERDRPVFRAKSILKMQGDALLATLQNGEDLQSWGEVVRKAAGTNQIVCVLPPPSDADLALVLTNGSVYRIGLTRDGLVYLPAGLYVASDPTRAALTKIAGQLEKDLRNEILKTPKPFIYSPGTIDDGGTLSGMARLFMEMLPNGKRFSKRIEES